MRADKVVQILKDAIPESMACWPNEAYGPYNVDLDKDIKRVLYCVTPTDGITAYFKDRHYDLLVNHHAFHASVPQFMAHTALDCCDGGLNDMFRVALQIKEPRHFDGTLGWYGKIDPISYVDLAKKVQKFIHYPIIGQLYTTVKEVKSVVVCTGLGGSVNSKALATGADCYILGEATQKASNSGFKAMIECGHTHSEWIGVRYIKKLLQPHGIIVHSAPPGIDRYSDERYVPWEGTYKGYGGKTFSGFRGHLWDDGALVTG